MHSRISPLFLALTLSAIASCGGSQEGGQPPSDVEGPTVDLIPKFAAALAEPSGLSGIRLRTGWTPPTGGELEGWRTATTELASLWIPQFSADAPTHLELVVRAPHFSPFEFELTVHVNGVAIHTGEVGKEEVTLRLPLEVGRTLRGQNLVELHSSHVLSPNSVGVGSSRRVWGISLRSVRLLGDNLDEPLHGGSASLVVPVKGRVRGEIHGSYASLLVQDVKTGRILREREVSGAFECDLAEEEGREVLVTLWSSDVVDFELSMEGGWRPANVILIVCDTLRLDAALLEDTPNLNRILDAGVGFPNAFSHAPMTLPSHTAMFSSRLPHHSGVVNNGMRVPGHVKLLAEWMEEVGYSSHAVASIGTLWSSRVGVSLDRGFRTFEYGSLGVTPGFETTSILARRMDEIGAKSPFFLFAHFADPHDPYRDFDAAPMLGELLVDGHVVETFNMAIAPLLKFERELAKGPHRVEVRTISDRQIVVRSLHLRSQDVGSFWIERDITKGEIGEPSQAVVATFELDQDSLVDFEVWPSDHLEGPENLPRYLKEIKQVDMAIGQLVDDLQRRGLWEESLVVFTSDHGEEFGDHGDIGHVETLYDEVLRVPLIIKLPKGGRDDATWRVLGEQLSAGSEMLFRQIDLVPTMLDLLRLSPMPGAMGHSVLDGESRTHFAETHTPEAAHDLYAMRDEQYKLIFRHDTDTFEMYETSDRSEVNDVFESDGAQRKAWQVELRRVASAWAKNGAVKVDEAERSRLEALGYL